jgi:hypothetical protein
VRAASDGGAPRFMRDHNGRRVALPAPDGTGDAASESDDATVADAASGASGSERRERNREVMPCRA